MNPLPLWATDAEPSSPPSPSPQARPQVASVPAHLEATVWKANEFGTPLTAVLKSGWDALDAELAGGGWTCRSHTEVLQPRASVCEWRLLGPSLRSVVAAGQDVVVIGPAKHPYLPGLRHAGLDGKHLVWVQAETPAERLWVTEQLAKSNAAGAPLALGAPSVAPEDIAVIIGSLDALQAFLEVGANPLKVPSRDWTPSSDTREKPGQAITDIYQLIDARTPVHQRVEPMKSLVTEHLLRRRVESTLGEARPSPAPVRPRRVL